MARLNVDILGIIGNVISILMFASPMKTFKQVVKKKSTENYKGVPYMTTLLSTSLWTFYGVLKPEGFLVATVNGAGAALHIIYVILFLIYAPNYNTKPHPRRPVVKLVGAVNIVFLGAVILVTLVALENEDSSTRIAFVGFVCAGLTIGMYAAPLSSMRSVMKMKSVKYMPFFLSFFQFLNGGVWFLYAWLIKDLFIGVPNGIGFLLGLGQLILYMTYRNKSIPEKMEEEEEEEGSAHLTENDDLEIPSLNKGHSLPNTSVVPQYNHNIIIKTLSLSSYESGTFNVNKGHVDVETF
ncbi:hypothetical protein ACJIZ3_000906 [Penstemon smallii]|uniref:Bidirectional sugar transporter SWEET n=1 Tax=Penstemon smallii TaxID=265156 RepID=A0ABD3U4I5_9LAMI